MKKILIAVTGSVAVIKVKKLQELLKERYEIKTIVSDYIQEHFDDVNELNYINEEKNLFSFPKHIELARWADLILVVPATANTISKFHSGISDNFLLSTLIAARQKIFFVPAMNTYMYKALIERNIINNLSNMGHIFIGPVIGMLREGESGLGRMMEPEDIKECVDNYFCPTKEKILIVNGAPKVFIDPIRYLTNSSTGNMGRLLFNELRLKGFNAELLDISTFNNNKEIVEEISKKEFDIYISTAAISNFKTIKNEEKIKSKKTLNITFEQDIDVLSEVKKLKPKTKLIAFKHDNDKNNAIKKMHSLGLYSIV